MEFVGNLDVLIYEHLHAFDGVLGSELDFFHVRLNFEKRIVLLVVTAA